MNFLLIAILSYSTGVGAFQNSRSYQTSAMQKFDTFDECALAAQALLATYAGGNIARAAPDRGQVRCVDLKTKVSKIVFQSGEN